MIIRLSKIIGRNISSRRSVKKVILIIQDDQISIWMITYKMIISRSHPIRLLNKAIIHEEHMNLLGWYVIMDIDLTILKSSSHFYYVDRTIWCMNHMGLSPITNLNQSLDVLWSERGVFVYIIQDDSYRMMWIILDDVNKIEKIQDMESHNQKFFKIKIKT